MLGCIECGCYFVNMSGCMDCYMLLKMGVYGFELDMVCLLFGYL